VSYLAVTIKAVAVFAELKLCISFLMNVQIEEFLSKFNIVQYANKVPQTNG